MSDAPSVEELTEKLFALRHCEVGTCTPGYSCPCRERAVDAAKWVAAAGMIQTASQSAWRPISEAPRDGHRLLLAGLNCGCPWTDIGHFAPYDGSQWNTDDRQRLQGVTHWQPLPQPPGVK